MSKLFQFDKPNFTNQFGTGTLSEQRIPPQAKAKPDAANIIGASADGLDSVTNLLGMLMNKPTTQEENYTAPPPPPTKKKVSPWAIGGIVAAVALIILLIVKSNGKPTSTSK